MLLYLRNKDRLYLVSASCDDIDWDDEVRFFRGEDCFSPDV